MKLFRKLDNYLLHYYPTIWITRIHSFLPIGLGIALLLFLITASVPWNPADDEPDNSISIVLMIIPVLIYLVYWFIFQSRYNVSKSGVRMPLSFEYLNFLSYMLVFFTAFLITSAIPLGNYQRMHNSINEEEFKSDVKALDLGNSLVFGNGSVRFTENETISFIPSDFVYYYNYSDYSYDYSEEYSTKSEITVSRNQAEQIISNFIKAYNKYTYNGIHKTSKEILAEIELNGYTSNLYNDEYYYDSSWDVQFKISNVFRCMEDGWYGEFSEGWFWKISLGVMAFLSMLVWIFKQMKLRQFVFGFISLCLTPLFAGIIAVIIFELLQIRSNEEHVISMVVLAFYIFFTVISIRAFMSSTLHNTGYVITMYVQFFLPLLPLFLWLFFANHNYWSYYYDFEPTANFLYFSGWVIGLASIAAFKPLYTKFRSLPSKN
jgi:hypothetical protein